MLFELAWISNVDFRSLSWNRLITSVSVDGFWWNLVGDMASVCRFSPMKMSSIGGGSRFGGNSKVYKCSLSWNRLITQTSVIGFHSNLVGDMASVLWCYPVKMNSIGGGLRFGGNSKVYKCSLSWNHLITQTDDVGFWSNFVGDMCTMCATCPVKMS